MKMNTDLKTQACIEACSQCYQSCLKTMNHCLKMGGRHLEPAHLTLLQDCAEMCKMAESLMLRNSLYSKKVCQDCAEICDRCALSCEEIDPDDETMMQCSRICVDCARACRKMQEAAIA